MTRVLFLADSGPSVGGGHVMRCLTLAKALEAQGASCAFVSPPAVEALLESFGAPEGGMLRVPHGEDAAVLVDAAAASAGARAFDVVVVDHYRLGAQTEASLRPAKVVVMDDLADRNHDCDLLVDPGLGRSPEAYAERVPAEAIRLIGPAYALVRPRFAELRQGSLVRRRERPPVRRALVALGLTDPGGVTGEVVRGLLHDFGRIEVDVAIGREAISLPFLRELAAVDPRIRLHLETPEMAELMAASDVAVGAGGSSIWERACLGLPSITIVVADNQQQVAARLEEMGASLALNTRALAFEAMLSAEWYGLVANDETRARMTEASAALCDGEGAGRVARAVLDLVA